MRTRETSALSVWLFPFFSLFFFLFFFFFFSCFWDLEIFCFFLKKNGRSRGGGQAGLLDRLKGLAASFFFFFFLLNGNYPIAMILLS